MLLDMCRVNFGRFAIVLAKLIAIRAVSDKVVQKVYSALQHHTAGSINVSPARSEREVLR